MPRTPTPPRKNAPGQGRKKQLTDPVKIEFWLERSDRDLLDLLSDKPYQRAEHLRTALGAYLRREDIQERLQHRRAPGDRP